MTLASFSTISTRPAILSNRYPRTTVFCPECDEVHLRTEPSCPIVNGTLEGNNVCTKCSHRHRGGRPNNSQVCDVQTSHAGADADSDRYCTCAAPEPKP